MHTKLFKKSWLCRTLVIESKGEDFLDKCYVKYDGRGMGNEKVYVDGTCVCSVKSWVWFSPRFEFPINGQRASMEVRVSPWLTVQSLKLLVNNSLEYSEGKHSITSDSFYVGASLLAFFGLFCGIMLLFSLSLIILFGIIL